MKPTNLLLTKEAFEQYYIRLREEQAHKYGMTLEEWDAAVLNGQTVNPITQPNNNIQHNINSGSKTT